MILFYFIQYTKKNLVFYKIIVKENGYSMANCTGSRILFDMK